MGRFLFVLSCFLFTQASFGQDGSSSVERVKYYSQPLPYEELVASVHNISEADLDVIFSRLFHEINKLPETISAEKKEQPNLRDIELLMQIVVSRATSSDYLERLRHLSNLASIRLNFSDYYNNVWIYQIRLARLFGQRSIARNNAEYNEIEEKIYDLMTRMKNLFTYFEVQRVSKLSSRAAQFQRVNSFIDLKEQQKFVVNPEGGEVAILDPSKKINFGKMGGPDLSHLGILFMKNSAQILSFTSHTFNNCASLF